MLSDFKFKFLIGIVLICVNISCENVTAHSSPPNIEKPLNQYNLFNKYVEVIPPSDLKTHNEHDLNLYRKYDKYK